MFEIEKGIKIPEDGNRRNRKYPFREMDVGDSFFVPCTDEEYRKIQSTIKSATRKITPNDFTVRKVENGVRCWRIK